MGVVSTYHSKYLKELGITRNIEAYTQSAVLKAALELVTFERCQSIFEGMNAVEKAIERLGGADAGAILEMLKDRWKLPLK